jgi:HlyD family secretion protein
MKVWKLVLMLLIVLALVLPAVACSRASQPPATPVQQTPVVRGDLTLKVSDEGKIGIFTDANLSFGSGGKLDTLNVREGDSVARGALLAKLDTTGLEVSLAQGKVALDQARLGQTQAQAALNQAQLARIQAESALTAAQFNLDRTTAVNDIKDEITRLQWEIQIAEMRMQEDTAISDRDTSGYWRQQIGNYNIELGKQNKKLADLLSNAEYTGTGALTYNIMGQTYDRLTVEDAHMKELAVEAAQKTVDQTQNGIDLAQQSLDKSKDGVALAQQSIDYIQKQINDSTIMAPFDGMVATLYHKQGDTIPSPVAAPQPVVYLVDSTNLEADIYIDETDISSIQAGRKALVSVDGFPGTTLEGKIFWISSLPSPQAALIGATAYTAKVSFTAPQGLAIKAGMNASADIITGERKNVLLLPNEVIKTDNQGKNYVETLNGDKMATQPVVIGMSDKFQTEVVSGLNEGDKVIAPVAAGRWSSQ